MPLKIVRHLDDRASKLQGFRDTLANAPIFLERAEGAHRMFFAFREKILEEAPNVYELKGLVAGINSTEMYVRRHQDRIREELKQERIEPEVAKPVIRELHAAWKTAEAEAKGKRDELTRLAGKIDGYYWAAVSALEQVEATVAQMERASRREEDEEDWSGRGTPDGVRRGKQATVTPIDAAKGNGEKKRRAPRKSRVRKAKPKTAPEETPVKE